LYILTTRFHGSRFHFPYPEVQPRTFPALFFLKNLIVIVIPYFCPQSRQGFSRFLLVRARACATRLSIQSSPGPAGLLNLLSVALQALQVFSRLALCTPVPAIPPWTPCEANSGSPVLPAFLFFSVPLFQRDCHKF